MKKVYINFKDKDYAKLLYKTLKLKYRNLDIEMFDEFVDLHFFDGLVISDEKLKIENLVLLNTDELKYSKIEKIYELLLEKSDFDIVEKKNIITVVDLDENRPINNFLINLLETSKYKENSILINMNYFSNYFGDISGNSVDSLIMSKNEVYINCKNSINYLNSSRLPKEVEKKENYIKAFNRLRTTKFSNMIVDINFSFSEKFIEIVKLSSRCIFIFRENNEYIREVVKYFSTYKIRIDLIQIVEDKFIFSSKDGQKNFDSINTLGDVLIC